DGIRDLIVTGVQTCALPISERAFARTMASRDHQAFASFLSQEAVFFSGPKPLRGAQQVTDWWKRYYEGPDAPFSWEAVDVEVLRSEERRVGKEGRWRWGGVW